MTGAVSRPAVIDLDPRNGGEASLAELEARWGPLPETLEVATGVELSTIAELVPEPDNPIDPLAVSVRIEGRMVGHLRREDARRLRAVVLETRRHHGRATCRAVIRGGWDRGRSDVGSFGVVVLVPGSSPGRSC